MDSIIETFHIDWKVIIAQAVNFGIVFVVLYIFALKPLNKLMAERSEKIEKGLTDAKQNASLLTETQAQYDEMLAKAKVEANKLYQDAKKDGEVEKAGMIQDAKTQVASIIEDGKKTLEADKTKMVAEAKKEIVNLAMLATEKIVGAKPGQFDEKVIRDLNNI